MISSALFLLALLADPAPTPGPTPTPVVAGASRLGDIRLKTSRSEAERKLAASSGTATPGSADLPEREEVPKTRSVTRVGRTSEHLDTKGRGEAWWRARAEAARAAVARAEEGLARAEQDLSAASGAVVSGPRGRVGGSVAPAGLLAMLQARVDEWRGRLEKARAGWEALQEEARKSDAYPGWLR